MAHQRLMIAAFVVSVTLLPAVEGLAVSRPNKLSRISCDVAAHPAMCDVRGREESFSSLQRGEELALQERELPLPPVPLHSRRLCRLRGGVRSDGTAEGILSGGSERDSERVRESGGAARVSSGWTGLEPGEFEFPFEEAPPGDL